jgi:hypothetical protein
VIVSVPVRETGLGEAVIDQDGSAPAGAYTASMANVPTWLAEGWQRQNQPIADFQK